MTVLQVGAKGIDYSGAHPSPHATRAAGGRFVIRYSAGAGNAQPGTRWKLCGVHEIRDAVAVGLDFIANSEWYESRITEGGRAGQVDGRADLLFWRSRGLARGATIYVSWDQAPKRLKWGAALRYLQAYDKALGGYYHVDCYAGTPFLRYALRKGVIRFGWRTNAGSWSGDGLPYQPHVDAAMIVRAQKATPAHLWQDGNYWYHKQADENVILRLPVGSHLEALAAGKPRPAPAPKPAPRPPGRAARYYPATHTPAALLVSPDGDWSWWGRDDGRIDARYRGTHRHYLGGTG